MMNILFFCGFSLTLKASKTILSDLFRVRYHSKILKDIYMLNDESLLPNNETQA